MRLAANAERVVGDLARYDDLVAHLDRDGWVVTHGEPHSGNVIRDPSGRLHLAAARSVRGVRSPPSHRVLPDRGVEVLLAREVGKAVGIQIRVPSAVP